jgi:hypothetical protein
LSRPLRSAILSLEETGAPRREILLPVGWITVTKKRGFASMAQNTAKLAGSSSAFVSHLLDNSRLASDRTDFSLE